VRIAHLDTGYAPDHPSRPRFLLRDLAWDFWDNRPGAVDPGPEGLFPFPGHGTATLALLAAPRISLPGDVPFEAEFGGAPDAEVVPVRISPSVVDIATAAMAQGIAYAVKNGCDVITISHGGPPAASWAKAVNDAYEAGVVVVAAAGDNINAGEVDILSHNTTYPSAFNRVITVVGATYERTPYQTRRLLALQGNFGPPPVMEKAIAAFTPNIAWMNYTGAPVFRMNGGGTSACAPQVAAACALWLSLYGSRLPKDWRRVEACRVALFESAARKRHDVGHLGWGIIDVPAFLAEDHAADVIRRALSGQLYPSPPDSINFSLFRLLFGAPPPGAAAERMYEAEVAQVVHTTDHKDLLRAAYAAVVREPPPSPPPALRQALRDHETSKRLKAWMAR
jgi:hypothetical protein